MKNYSTNEKVEELNRTILNMRTEKKNQEVFLFIINLSIIITLENLVDFIHIFSLFYFYIEFLQFIYIK